MAVSTIQMMDPMLNAAAISRVSSAVAGTCAAAPPDRPIAAPSVLMRIVAAKPASACSCAST